jgi:hypothetical protein
MCCSFPREQNMLSLLTSFLSVYKTEDHVRVCLHDSVIKLHERSFIMKMHSVVYSQSGAPAYTSMLLYAWKKPGYAIHKTFDVFVNTTAVSFNFGLETCLTEGCITFAFIRCSYSTCFYCFEHFIPNPHLTLTLTMMMTCNMSFLCATMIFTISINISNISLFNPMSIEWAVEGTSITWQANSYNHCTQQPTIHRTHTVLCGNVWLTKDTSLVSRGQRYNSPVLF